MRWGQKLFIPTALHKSNKRLTFAPERCESRLRSLRIKQALLARWHDLCIRKCESRLHSLGIKQALLARWHDFCQPKGANDCACGEIGRRARLRIWCSDTCRFESYQAHDWTKEEFSKEFSSFLFSSSTDGDGLSRIGKSLRPRASGMIYCQHEFKREFKQKHAS